MKRVSNLRPVSRQMVSKATTSFLVFAMVLLLTGTESFAQLPVVRVRFANPVYNSVTQSYRADVEFQSDKPGLEVFAMNVRFVYDDAALEFASFGDFKGEYGVMNPYPPVIITGKPKSGALPGFKGDLEYINGAIKLKQETNPVRLTSDGWIKLFSVNFTVDDPTLFAPENCCPDLIWDLEANPSGRSFMTGSEGVVITAIDPSPQMVSMSVLEEVMDLSMNKESGQLVVTGVKEISDAMGLAVWPNPTTGPVHVDLNWKKITDLEVRVLDVLGVEVFRKEYKAGERIRFDLSQVASGPYVVELKIDDVSVLHKLIVDRKN